MSKIVRVLLPALLALVLTGCGSDQKSGEYVVYYLNAGATRVVGQESKIEQEPDGDIVEELLTALATQPKNSSLRQTIPASVKVLGHTVSSYQITVDFSSEYYNLAPIEEVLTRAAVAKTLFQVDGCSYVLFTVESKPLVNGNGTTVGSMRSDSFVENPGQQINSSMRTTLKLYFADKDGSGLVEETRVVYHSSNISMEKLVMEQLIKGPNITGAQATIPAGTKLINVAVVDRICYISLDETFLNQNLEISEQVVLFSIVNSVTQLANVEKVQISINGDTSGKCRYVYPLAALYEADESYIVTDETQSEETENAKNAKNSKK